MSLLRQGHRSAHHLFFILFRTVLCRCATLALHQGIKKRCRSGDGSVSVQSDDVEAAYAVAERVGRKWMLKLLEAGEDEMMMLLEIALKEGKFFESIEYNEIDVSKKQVFYSLDDDDDIESQSLSSTAGLNQCNNLQTHDYDAIDKMSTANPFMAISRNLEIKVGLHEENSTSPCGEGTSSDWHPLPSLPLASNLSKQNHIPCCTILPENQIERCDPNQLFGVPRKTLIEHANMIQCHPIVGKEDYIRSQIKILDSLGRNKNTSWQYDWNVIESACRRNNNRMHQEDCLSSRKRQKLVENEQVRLIDSRESATNTSKISGYQHIEQSITSWTMEDAYKCFSTHEINVLVDKMVHSQDKDSSQEIPHNCVGALKITGNTHLWEQVRQGNWNGPMDEVSFDVENDVFVQKKRKKAYLKSKRQRLYPHSETKRVEHINKLSSKISFTEMKGRHSIDFDLGECIISLKSGVKRISRKFAFKSLEICLVEDELK